MNSRRLSRRTLESWTRPSWKAMVDDPVLLCPCQDGDWCQWCEPLAEQSPHSAQAPPGLLPTA